MKRRPPKRDIIIRWVLIGAAALGVAVVITGWVIYTAELRPVDTKLPAPVPFSITPGESTPTIARQMEASGIIRSRWAFSVYVELHGLRRKIEAGYYELSPADSTVTNAKIVARGIVVNKAFLVREGETIQQIENQAASTWLRGVDLPTALGDSYPNTFLAQRPASSSLEGYLFPDTYEIAPSTSPHQLIQAMLNNFGQKVTPGIVTGMAAKGLTLHQGITLASIIQSEVSHPADMPVVAQIFYKRLSLGMPLESSVTAFYGADQLGLTNVTEANAASVNSPYNTYIHTGLPPGPISNPGLAAINAVVSPSNTDYLYFIADKQGNTHFETTFAQHEADVSQYLGQ